MPDLLDLERMAGARFGVGVGVGVGARARARDGSGSVVVALKNMDD